MNETRYPLCWPANWKRTTSRASATFSKTSHRDDATGGYVGRSKLSVPAAVERISVELFRMGIKEEGVIVSTNVALNLSGGPRGDRGEPSDPGVAVYWTRNGKSQCIAIDRYRRVADNLAAVAATLLALRAIERHGGGSILDRAFIGFAALPAAPVDWRAVLCIHPQTNVTQEIIENAFRVLAVRRHPDKGGTHDMMAELNAARAEALRENRW
jgi:hypothetical protein